MLYYVKVFFFFTRSLSRAGMGSLVGVVHIVELHIILLPFPFSRYSIMMMMMMMMMMVMMMMMMMMMMMTMAFINMY